MARFVSEIVGGGRLQRDEHEPWIHHPLQRMIRRAAATRSIEKIYLWIHNAADEAQVAV